MLKKKYCICIIPARGGSKRIKKKNIKSFFGKPMIAYAINNAKKSSCFNKIIVSTDDKEIIKVSKKYGADVLFVRPKKLSDDYTPLAPVIKHAIDEIKRFNIEPSLVCVLTATSPLLNYKHLVKSKKIFQKSKCKFLVSVNKYDYPIQRALVLGKNDNIRMYNPKKINKRSQDLNDTFHDAGQFYWGKPINFTANAKILSDNTKAYLINGLESVDIDTKDDWYRAKTLFKTLKPQKK